MIGLDLFEAAGAVDIAPWFFAFLGGLLLAIAFLIFDIWRFLRRVEKYYRGQG